MIWPFQKASSCPTECAMIGSFMNDLSARKPCNSKRDMLKHLMLTMTNKSEDAVDEDQDDEHGDIDVDNDDDDEDSDDDDDIVDYQLARAGSWSRRRRRGRVLSDCFQSCG